MPTKINVIKIITLFLITIIIAVIAIATYFNVVYANKIFPNITINGTDYSGFTKKQATEKLEKEIKNAYQNGFIFTYQDKIYQAEISEIGTAVNIEKVVNNAFIYGHKKDVLQNIREQLKLVCQKRNVKIEIGVNKTALENYISATLSEIETPPKNFGYFYDGEKFIPSQSKSGMLINKKRLTEDIFSNLSELKNETIKLELKKVAPEIKKDLNKSALAEAQNLLSKKIILKYNSTEWEVQKEDFALWIGFGTKDNFLNDNATFSNSAMLGVTADKDKIKKYLVSLVPQINSEPINAQLTFNQSGKVDIFSLSQEGVALQIEKSLEEIGKTIFVEENCKNNSEINLTIQLVTKKVQPEITTASIDNMGITTLLATGESNFYGSPRNRRHNIAIGASRFHGALIGPEDEFSFNNALGKVGAKQGYLPELVIKKDKTVLEYGGGLCQVSTTAFRGAVKAGFEITERESHAYPVQYYNPQGTDATIYPPRPDLKFKNNTPAYVLIQTRIEGNKLYFDFYGSNDKREVILKGPYVYSRKPDGSMKASWTQEVYNQNGKLRFKKTFYSNYRSPALYPH
ncbi:MAG: VanW family protein [Patescibacteria group bacterium]|nr:VanW family protein [Patescibacteria group bacterium]